MDVGCESGAAGCRYHLSDDSVIGDVSVLQRVIDVLLSHRVTDLASASVSAGSLL